jgi:hypothetical protein
LNLRPPGYEDARAVSAQAGTAPLSGLGVSQEAPITSDGYQIRYQNRAQPIVGLRVVAAGIEPAQGVDRRLGEPPCRSQAFLPVRRSRMLLLTGSRGHPELSQRPNRLAERPASGSSAGERDRDRRCAFRCPSSLHQVTGRHAVPYHRVRAHVPARRCLHTPWSCDLRRVAVLIRGAVRHANEPGCELGR